MDVWARKIKSLHEINIKVFILVGATAAASLWFLSARGPISLAIFSLKN
jgi:hypothetical protein